MDDPMLVFVHLPKTGGSTLATLIRRHYPGASFSPAGNMFKDPDRVVPALQELSAAEPRVRATYGHITLGFRRYLRPHARYVTLLREPLERTLSHYYYVQRAENMQLLAGRSIERTLREGGTIADNLQTRMLSNRTDPVEGDAAELFDEARANLRRSFDVVGLTERFDESLLLIARLLGWRAILCASKRVNRSRPFVADLDSATLAALRRYNEVDLALYDVAIELFEERATAYGDPLTRDLRSLRAARAAWSGGPSLPLDEFAEELLAETLEAEAAEQHADSEAHLARA